MEDKSGLVLTGSQMSSDKSEIVNFTQVVAMEEEEKEVGKKRKFHNKSNSTFLKVISIEEKKIDELLALKTWMEMKSSAHNPIEGSPCRVPVDKKGTISSGGFRIDAYQLVAYKKWGREELKKVPPAKQQDDLLISHLCGTLFCVNKDHLILEAKRINDERAHCHFCLAVAFKNGGYVSVKAALQLICPHNPRCLSLNP